MRKKAKFEFKQHWSSGFQFYEREGLKCATLTFRGVLKNRGLEPNSLIDIDLVVWTNVRRNRTHRFGHGSTKIEVPGEGVVELPLRLLPKEAKGLEITFDFPITGTCDRKLLAEAQRPVAWVYKNRLDLFIKTRLLRQGRRCARTGYELAFEDVDNNLFDQYGFLRNRKEIDLWWTLSNYKGAKWIRELVKIGRTKLCFRVRVLLRKVGLSS